MSRDLPKPIRAALRSLAGAAHERELHRLLEGLDAEFARWRRGEIDSFALSDAVDRLARGRERRDLAGRYASSELLPMLVARAIVAGLLRPDEVPAEVTAALDHELGYFRRGLADGSIRLDVGED
jgi:hypothetical protein